MRIKRVEIIGFKSFCDRAVVNIDADITGIVGPNGCGKSNIVDAIRWAMGEQSAKHLRGKAMEDVIFAGSESRGPAPMAEVSITFDDVGFSAATLELAQTSEERDAEQQLDALVPDGEVEVVAEVETAPETQATWTDAEGNPIASPQEEVAELLADRPPPEFATYTEVTLTRRLYRDGLSQYYINKTPCRLRDITDFFLGTGVGTKAYAIIEQGRVGQIVSSRPQDRRAIIEEAAGITKFKAKKKAAEKKLDQTRQNLMRVSDIVTELDKRMGTLRRQAQKAERYRKYKTELRDIDLWKATHKWLELHAEHQLVRGGLDATRTGLDDAHAAWTAKDAHVVAERAELSLEERRLVGVQNEIHELDNRLRLGESKIAFERREADELDARAQQARTEIEQIASQREQGAAELAARTAELAALAGNVERELAEVASREQAAAAARIEVTATQHALDAARAELATRRTEIATADTQLEALGRRRDEAQRRLERVMSESEQALERQKDLDREGKRVSHELATLRQTKLDLGSHAEAFELRKDALADDVARGEAEVETLRTELHRRRSRLTSLQELQQRYEGFQRGTRMVMQQAARIADDASQIRGLVADVVRAPEQLEVAVEAVLGDRLGGVIVDEPSIGVAAIGFLKQAGGGRSAFVPLEPMSVSVPAPAPAAVPRFEGEGGSASWMSPAWDSGSGSRSGSIEVDDRTQLVAAMSASHPATGEGVLGRMADLVGFADGYEQVGKRLLGGTVVVDGLERALELHGKGVTDRLVTLDGDVVAEDGVVAGGSRDAQGAGVLAQKREIRDLDEIVGKLEHDLNEAMQRLVTAKTELQQLVKALDALRAQAHQGELAIIGHEKDDTRVRGELERTRRQLDQLGHEQLELEARLSAITIDDETARERRRVADDRMAELERSQLDLTASVTELRDRLDAMVAELTEARVRAAQLGEKRAAAEASTLRLETADRELAARAERLEHEIADATRRTCELRAGCEELELELAAQRETREARVAELDAGRSAYETRLGALTEVELAARELRTTADALQKELGRLELRDGQLVMTRQVLEDGVLERHQVAVASLLHDYHQRPQVTEVEDARLAELKDLIERMGTDINLTAIEEFDEVSKRFEFLSAQRIDLDRAVDQLQRAIDKINKTSRKLFKDTFAAVNATFKEVFPRLFRGGQAALSLAAAKSEDGSAPGGGEVDLLEAGIEIMAQPPGKKNSTVDQLSGGEKALTAVALVFSIFLIKPSPFCVLDEVDAPLDEANVDRYNQMVREMTDRSQFIVITHNKRTMETADNLYGVTMQEPGVSKLVSVNLAKLGAKASAAAS
ncbi:MAG TPA: chromosome segregation protein SMC [Kofleriaceae bacterium]|jgi:chromosome segregation protein